MIDMRASLARQFATKGELWVAGIAFSVMLGVIIVNVFLRALFSSSILSSEELAYLGFTWSTFAAVVWLYRTRGLIAVDVFLSLFPLHLQRGLIVLTDVALIAANAWFCWLSWVLASGGWVRKTPVLDIPYFWVNLAPLLAFALMTLWSVVHLVQGLQSRVAIPPGSHTPDAASKESS